MFVIWDGQSAGSSHAGMPIAFSRDGKKLAVLHPSSGPGSSSSGWLEILSVPGLNSIASYSHTTLRVANQGNGPATHRTWPFSPDATGCTPPARSSIFREGRRPVSGTAGGCPTGRC